MVGVYRNFRVAALVMRFIGQWIDLLRDTRYPPPQELVGDYDLAVQQSVADYLDHGHVYARYRGLIGCLFYCGHTEGHVERTDGHWVWPCNLSHYVRDHSVLVPEDFINHASSWRVLPDFDETWQHAKPDHNYWLQWCQRRATGQLRPQFVAALAHANQEAERLLTAMANELEAQSGLSDSTCVWAGCTSHALSGKAFCGRCCF